MAAASTVQQRWPTAFGFCFQQKQWLTRSALSCCSYYYYDYSYHHGEQITSPQASFFMAFLLFLPIELDKWGIRKLPFKKEWIVLQLQLSRFLLFFYGNVIKSLSEVSRECLSFRQMLSSSALFITPKRLFFHWPDPSTLIEYFSLRLYFSTFW